MKRLFFSLLLISCVAAAQFAFADDVRASMANQASATGNNAAVQETYKDIKSVFGFVPTFFKQFPEKSLPGAWSQFKSIQLSANSAIPNKYKELMGLAIASQIPCHYCTYFHTTAAKFFGANDKEVQEAVAISALERQWSTFISGTQSDFDTFKDDTQTFLEKTRAAKESTTNKQSVTASVNASSSPEAVYKEIEDTMGTVPEFLKKYPQSGIAGAWDHLKNLAFSENSAIPAKYKDLISLAVSSQIPCTYCIYFDTEAAKANGASEAEIQETVALSSISRHWSTVLNGVQTNEAQFRSEINRSFDYIKKNSKG